MAITKSQLTLLGVGGGSAEELLRPTVTWLLNGCPGPRPESVDDVVCFMVMVGCALLWHQLTTRDPKLAAEIEGDAQPDGDLAAGNQEKQS